MTLICSSRNIVTDGRRAPSLRGRQGGRGPEHEGRRAAAAVHTPLRGAGHAEQGQGRARRGRARRARAAAQPAVGHGELRLHGLVDEHRLAHLVLQGAPGRQVLRAALLLVLPAGPADLALAAAVRRRVRRAARLEPQLPAAPHLRPQLQGVPAAAHPGRAAPRADRARAERHAAHHGDHRRVARRALVSRVSRGAAPRFARAPLFFPRARSVLSPGERPRKLLLADARAPLARSARSRRHVLVALPRHRDAALLHVPAELDRVPADRLPHARALHRARRRGAPPRLQGRRPLHHHLLLLHGACARRARARARRRARETPSARSRRR